MELLKTFINFFIHLDVHLSEIIQNYGIWTYGILFMIIFMETGFVVNPFSCQEILCCSQLVLFLP